MASASALYVYATESTAGTLSKPDGLFYAYESTAGTLSVRDGLFYAYESTAGILSKADGLFYAYDNTIVPPNPTRMKRWDGTQWVQDPYYIWNGSAWVQVF